MKRMNSKTLVTQFLAFTALTLGASAIAPIQSMAWPRDRRAAAQETQELLHKITALVVEINAKHQELQEPGELSPLASLEKAPSLSDLRRIHSDLLEKSSELSDQIATRRILIADVQTKIQSIENSYLVLNLETPNLYQQEIASASVARLVEIKHELEIKDREARAMLGNLRNRNEIRFRAENRANRYFNNLERGNYLDSSPTTWVEGRCAGLLDSIESNVSLVQGRRNWAHKCLVERQNRLEEINRLADRRREDPSEEAIYQQFLAQRSAIKVEGPAPFHSANRWYYPSFGKIDPNSGTISNPDLLVAPMEDMNCSTSIRVDAAGNRISAVNIDLLENNTLVAMCVTGCYTPDQNIQYSSGYMAIGDAFRAGKTQVMTLTPDSTLEHPVYEVNEIAAYTADVTDALQEVTDFRTESNRRLTVTRSHAMMDATGAMRPADTFSVGDAFVTADGSLDRIVEANSRSYYGKVYNIRLGSEDPRKNIVVAEGLMTGTVFFQNEGVRDLNRAIFRLQLPNQL